jgi:hypothetical protein
MACPHLFVNAHVGSSSLSDEEIDAMHDAMGYAFGESN